MKIEQEAARSEQRSQSEILKECWVYAPVFLTDDLHPDSDGSVSLFVRRYRLVRTPKGKLVVRFLKDVLSFENEDAMVAKIDADKFKEMPDDEPGAGYVPTLILAEYTARIAA